MPGVGGDIPGWREVEQDLKSRVGTLAEGPVLVFYHDFVREWKGFGVELKNELGKFLRLLQKDAFGAEIVGRTQQHEPYFASELDCGAVVYWKLEVEGNLITISTPPERILILAIQFD